MPARQRPSSRFAWSTSPVVSPLGCVRQQAVHSQPRAPSCQEPRPQAQRSAGGIASSDPSARRRSRESAGGRASSSAAVGAGSARRVVVVDMSGSSLSACSATRRRRHQGDRISDVCRRAIRRCGETPARDRAGPRRSAARSRRRHNQPNTPNSSRKAAPVRAACSGKTRNAVRRCPRSKRKSMFQACPATSINAATTIQPTRR